MLKYHMNTRGSSPEDSETPRNHACINRVGIRSLRESEPGFHAHCNRGNSWLAARK